MSEKNFITINEDGSKYYKKIIEGNDGILKDFDPEKVKREQFTCLGDWKIYMKPEGYGLAHRTGYINFPADAQDDPTELYLDFGLVVASENHKITNEEIENVSTTLKKIIEVANDELSSTRPNIYVISMLVPPPQYMIDELMKLYGNDI